MWQEGIMQLLGSFMTVDPLAEKYYSISPYAYCHDNPVNKIDPDGRGDENSGGKRSKKNKVNGVYTAAQSATAGNQPREVTRPIPIKKLTPMQQAVKTAQSQPKGEIKAAQTNAQKSYNSLSDFDKQALHKVQ